jgi:O-antigen/teichoic acid export membrane protein
MEVNSTANLSRIKYQTLFMIAGKITALLATFAVPLILTRLLSKSQYGIFAQFYVVVFFCTGVFNLSVQSNLYYFYPTANDRAKRSLIFQTLFFLMLVALLAVSLLSIPAIGKFLIGEGELIVYKNYILLGILLLMPVFIIEPLYVVKKDIFTSLIYPPAEVLLRLSLVIGLFIINPGLSSIFSGVIISATACLVFVLAYTTKEIGIKNMGLGLLDAELAGKQLKYSIPFGMATSLNILFQRFDKIICISFLTPSEFAVYAISFYGIPGILQIFDSLAQVYLIQMTIKHQENKTSELGAIYKLLVTKTYSFSLPALLIVMLYTKKIITVLFTSNYIDAVPLFRAYLFSILIFMLSSGLILRATGKTNYTLRSYLYSGVVILPLTYFLIKHIGVWGAMTGALVSLSLPRFLNLAKEIKLTNSNFANFFPWKQFLQITMISCITIIPFAALEFYFSYGILATALLGIIYLLIVALLELKYDLFPMDSTTIKNRFFSYISVFRERFTGK